MHKDYELLRFTRTGPGGPSSQTFAGSPLRREEFDPPLKTHLLILQPTPFCNINCSYCYLPGRSDVSRMTHETLQLAARHLRQDELLGGMLSVVWHAGEPLVIPIEWYQAAFDILSAELGDCCRISHSIQTNATLIDDDWCQFFLRHRVRVGVSLDGPADLHDRHRRTRTGGGTHEAAMNGVRALQRHRVPYHAIIVITADSLDHAEDIHAFLLAEGVDQVGFNFDEAEGVHAESSLEGREGAHAAFLARMLDHMIADGARWQVREFSLARKQIVDGHPVWRWRGRSFPENDQVLPFALVSVAWNGDFSTFSPELIGQQAPEFGNFVFGNVHRSGYLTAFSQVAFRRIWNDVLKGVDTCRNACAYYHYCGGGAPANKYFENGSLASGETLYCRAMFQRPFEAVLSRMEAALR
ncbi:MAG: GRRM system radical SAM/SPASM domain protein [Hyphomicrobiaceae bacterium]|nr:GRRM system radical SAM/SPASM domain protein [Hyphomicrobiaceae bacterium]